MPALATAERKTTSAYAPLTKRQRYERLRSALYLERTSFEDHWRELGDYFLPRRTRFWTGDRNKGDRRSQKIVDSTGRFAVRTLASGLHAGLTSPARPWMKLSTPDPGLAKFAPVKAWLYEITERMLTLFNLSNLYNVLPIVYGDMGVFGTAAVGILDDPARPGKPGDLFRGYSYPIGSYALGLDTRGLVTTFVREYQMTVRQLIEEFGLVEGRRAIDWSRFSRTVKDAWDKSEAETAVDVCWVVSPSTDYRADLLDHRQFPWTSCWFEKGTERGDQVLRESGFHEFPVLCPRWDVTGEDTYGTDCPGMTALGDVKALQILQKRKAQAIEKQINPPLVAPTHLRTQQVSMIPGGLTYADEREAQKGLRPLHEVTSSIAELLQDVESHQYRIQRACYEDLFLMLATSDRRLGADRPTAREIDERHEEKLLALGPVLERTNDELLDPLIDRVFGMMLRAGLIPPPPPDLQGVELTVEYTSLMAEAQKLVGVAGTDRFMQTTLGLSEALPTVRHYLNAGAIVKKYHDMLGVDPAILRSDDEAEASMQAEQQAVQAQAEAEQVQRLAQGAAALGKTPMTGDTALTRAAERASA